MPDNVSVKVTAPYWTPAEVANLLERSPRLGTDIDVPEGYRYIQLSDTLVSRIMTSLRHWPDGFITAPIPFACRLGWHRWTQWTEPYPSHIIKGYIQTRRCVSCHRYNGTVVLPWLRDDTTSAELEHNALT